MKFWGTLAWLLVFPMALFANTTVWENLTFQDFSKGTGYQVILSADGTISYGLPLGPLQLSDIMAWSVAYDSKGNTYVGTGVHGVVYRLEQRTFQKYYETGELIVTALESQGDELYAGTIPDGKIFQIKDGKGDLWVKLPASYIWGMKLYEGKMYVATGPDGILYQVDMSSKEIKELVKTGEKHLLSMALSQNNIYVGSAPNAIVYRISPDGKLSVALDLPENEVRSLVACQGKLYIGVNVAKGFDNTRMVQTLAKNVQDQGFKGKLVDRKKIWEELMSSSVYQFEENKGWDKFFEFPKTFITTMASLEDKGILVGTGLEGKIYQIKTPEVWSVLTDLKEDQILSLMVKNDALNCLGTGDTGVLYTVSSEFVPNQANYLSEIHDTEAFSQFGSVEWEKEGELVLQTRTGNTQKADEFWSDWSTPITTSPAKLTSPAGRFFQYRVSWSQKEAILHGVRILYRRQNRAPVIKSFKLPTPSNPRKLYPEKSSNPFQVSWEAKDPDNDNLRFRLWYKNVKTDIWHETTANQIYTEPKFKWDASHCPDGYYLLKLEVSDELDNSIPGITRQISSPLLIDNRPPQISAQVEAGQVSGVASDSFSCIAHLAYRIQDGEWTLLDPADGIFDQCEESFRFSVASLAKGSTVELKAVDASGNAAYGFCLVK